MGKKNVKRKAIKSKGKKLRDLKPNEILVKVAACGVCGTDIRILEGTTHSTPPVILGHEYTGIVEDIGVDVTQFERGDKVVIDPNIVCGHCYYCHRGLVNLCENLTALGVDIDGGFAEYSIVPVNQAYKLYHNVPLEWGCFVEPLSCAIRGIDLANIQLGDTVVILGAGTVGLIMIQLVKLAGSSKIIVVEPKADRRKKASKLGANIVISLEEVDLKNTVMEDTERGADVVIECVGKPETMQLTTSLARRGGRIIFYGVCDRDAQVAIRPHEIYFKELTIRGSFVNPNTFPRALALLMSNRINLEELKTEKFSLTEILKAFEHHRKGLAIKTLVVP